MTRTPKKSKVAPVNFSEVQKACRTPIEHEQLALVVKARWKPAELHEYARLHFFKNGRDYPTALSYRRAIADIAFCSDYGPPYSWLKLFREGGSKPLSPRRQGLLQRGRGQSSRINRAEYAWYGHTEEYRSMIEQQARDYFKIAPNQPVHVNAWAASQNAYLNKLYRERLAAEKAAGVAKKPKTPRFPKKPQKPKKQKLAPEFNMEWEGHTAAFREEVADWVRKDRRLEPGAYVGPSWWKIACNRHYELTESTEA